MGSLRSGSLVFGGEGDGECAGSNVGEEGCSKVEFLRMREADEWLGGDLRMSTSCGKVYDCAICAWCIVSAGGGDDG